MSRFVLKGGTVLTLGEKTPNHHRADLVVDNGRVAEIGADLRIRDAEVIDASDTIVMPGFVDTHRHVWRSLFKNLGGFAAEIDATHLEPTDVYAATLIGLLGAIEAGITTVVDWADMPADETYLDAALQAHTDAGLRTVFVHGTRSPGSSAEKQAIARKIAEGATGGASALGSVDVTRAHLDQVAAEWAVGRELGLRIHAHAGLDKADAGAVSTLGEKGLLGDDVTLVHCTHLSDQDLDAMSTSATAIALAPSTEMAAGLGTPPLQRFLDRKIEPGLAVDDERLAPGDMFAQMRVTNSLQHAAYFDLKLAGKAGLPNLLTTRDMIRYATLVGAKAIGLGAVTGSLEPGKQADLIVLRTDRPNIYPINDPIGAVVWGVDTSNVDLVMVGGRVLMRDGALAGDVEHARTLAARAQERVVAAAGLMAESATGDPT
jgi:cytosine/adenosine deaminase-related metal-dependent hydrolase